MRGGSLCCCRTANWFSSNGHFDARTSPRLTQECRKCTRFVRPNNRSCWPILTWRNANVAGQDLEPLCTPNPMSCPLHPAAAAENSGFAAQASMPTCGKANSFPPKPTLHGKLVLCDTYPRQPDWQMHCLRHQALKSGSCRIRGLRSNQTVLSHAVRLLTSSAHSWAWVIKSSWLKAGVHAFPALHPPSWADSQSGAGLPSCADTKSLGTPRQSWTSKLARLLRTPSASSGLSASLPQASPLQKL